MREIQPFLLLGWRSSSPFHGLNEPFWFKPAPEVKPEGVYWVQMAFATAQSCVWGALSWWRWMAQAEERSVVPAGEIFCWHTAHHEKNRGKKKKKSSRHFLAFRAAKQARGRDQTLLPVNSLNPTDWLETSPKLSSGLLSVLLLWCWMAVPSSSCAFTWSSPSFFPFCISLSFLVVHLCFLLSSSFFFPLLPALF